MTQTNTQEDKQAGVHDPDAIADLRNDQEYCQDCGTELSVSLKGKKYCYARCWLKDK